jgi:hypothetical protein
MSKPSSRRSGERDVRRWYSAGYPVFGMTQTVRGELPSGGMFCSCLHTVESHHENGCHALHRNDAGALKRCDCRRSRDRVREGPDHLKDAVRLAAARAKRRV